MNPAGLLPGLLCLLQLLVFAQHLRAEAEGGPPSANVQEEQNNGSTATAVLVGEFVANVSGGAEEDEAFLTNVDLTLEIDTARAGLWLGGTVFLYLLDNRGQAPTSFVGDMQGTSNIEAESTLKLYEAWYEHAIANGRAAILGGLHDYNGEFYALENSAVFLNSSFGVGPEVAQMGPSIFPTTSLAVRLRYQPNESWYALAAAYDGVPGHPSDPRGTHIILRKEDGIFYAAEVGKTNVTETDYSKWAVGVWVLDRDFTDVTGNARTLNHGAYLIGERTLTDSLGGFVQIGYADESRNEISTYMGLGLQVEEFWETRPEDTMGLGVATAWLADGVLAVDPTRGRTETVVEFTYRAQIRPWLAVQPDLQFVINPGMDEALGDAWVFALRLEVAL